MGPKSFSISSRVHRVYINISIVNRYALQRYFYFEIIGFLDIHFVGGKRPFIVV